jgi:uncharacterized surface protein with fasciclin (FAS1) repeats
MKNLNLKKMMNFRSFTLVAIVVLAVFTVSCNKENDPFIADEAMFTESAEMKSARTPAKGTLSIAGIAVSEGFTELVTALSYVDAELSTGLVELFSNGKDQYTVFAPTNDAFFALYAALNTPSAPVTQITDLPAELVLNVLLYHVAEGRRAANSVVPPVGSRTITTLLGETFSVDTDGVITAIGNSATITGPNQSASNGIIHIIDTVLLPIE